MRLRAAPGLHGSVVFAEDWGTKGQKLHIDRNRVEARNRHWTGVQFQEEGSQNLRGSRERPHRPAIPSGIFSAADEVRPPICASRNDPPRRLGREHCAWRTALRMPILAAANRPRMGVIASGRAVAAFERLVAIVEISLER
jgi:hypothetical protein